MFCNDREVQSQLLEHRLDSLEVQLVESVSDGLIEKMCDDATFKETAQVLF